MDAALIDLGKRAVACEGWRWMPGMAWAAPPYYDDNGRLTYSEMRPLVGRVLADHEVDDIRAEPVPYDATPDLSDPATVGCLLALVREAWASQYLSPEYHGFARNADWRVYCFFEGGQAVCNGGTEAEALVCALEAASGQSTPTP